MSRKRSGVRLQCAEATAPDWSCCFLSLPPPASPGGIDSNGGFNLAWTLHQSFHPPAGLFASVGFQTSSPGNPRDPCMKYVSQEAAHHAVETPLLGDRLGLREKGKKNAVKIKIKVGNSNLKRLISGGIAGAVSRTVVAPLETIRTHLMVGSNGNSSTEVGLTPSLIGVVPYAATNYFAYDTLKKVYKKMFKTNEIGNVPTLLIGSAAGAISSTATFPLEVARKQMQVGAVGGRKVYKSMLHALLTILEDEGVGGLYRGLGPSCMKLVPAAGISFMCYEACKKILIEEDNE